MVSLNVPLSRRCTRAGAAAFIAATASAFLVSAACSTGNDAPPSQASDAVAPSSFDGSGSSDGGLPEATIAVELGTGSAAFVPLTDGEPIAMVRGKQGFQHIWISARVREPVLHDAIVTISTRRPDGRSGGPSLSAAVSLGPADGGAGALETVGLTGLVDYAVIGEVVRVHLELTTADGRRGFDERSVMVLAPITYRCTSDAGTTSCDSLCQESRCDVCESGTTNVGFVDGTDASSTPIASCAAPFAVDAVRNYACCCCR
jgi:hypothetical protein